MNSDCIFCEIVSGRVPAHVVWQGEKHIAFLSIFPNTDGFTVVATKKHHPSYAFTVDKAVLTGLVLASKTVARKIDNALEDVGRTGFILEGFGVDHLHSKLFPMHGTPKDHWEKLSSDKYIDKFFERYESYISSHDSKKADDNKLAKIASKIRRAKP